MGRIGEWEEGRDREVAIGFEEHKEQSGKWEREDGGGIKGWKNEEWRREIGDWRIAIVDVITLWKGTIMS